MTYTQPPRLTPEEREALLQKEREARFCSHNPDGTIHAATVNYLDTDGRLLVITPGSSQKARNVERNGTVTLLIDTMGKTLNDVKGLLVYGKATAREATASGMEAVSSTWMPPAKVKPWTERMREWTDWALISVTPERFASWDYGKDEKFAAMFQS